MRNGRRYLFTHAGISEGWYQKNRKIIGELTIHHLNQLQYTEEGMYTLGQIGNEANTLSSPRIGLAWIVEGLLY